MQAMNSLAEIIRFEAARSGPLPFARFMELALYHPEFGYYETQKHSPGRRGDFYTSVSTGELFGQLLACQFAEWLDQLKSLNPQPSTLNLMEAGAHDGKLAGDILTWFQSRRPKLFDQIEYVIIEPSARRQEWQRATLKEFVPRVSWLQRFNEPAIRQFNGVIFSNELLDAFPLRRFGWNAKTKKWFEWGVAVAGNKFIWAKLEDSELPSSILNLPRSLLDVLPATYTVETSPAAENWWREAAGVLACGKLMAIDYGFTADEMISPERTGGTLRAYSQHHASDDILANPGEQDLTAHVNFSAIQKAGEELGLKTEFFGTQTKFLMEILAGIEKNKSLGEWSGKQMRQFQTLTHPEHLGRAFRVLVQSR